MATFTLCVHMCTCSQQVALHSPGPSNKITSRRVTAGARTQHLPSQRRNICRMLNSQHVCHAVVGLPSLAVSADPTFSTMTAHHTHLLTPRTSCLSELLHNHHSFVWLTAHNELSPAVKPGPQDPTLLLFIYSTCSCSASNAKETPPPLIH